MKKLTKPILKITCLTVLMSCTLLPMSTVYAEEQAAPIPVETTTESTQLSTEPQPPAKTATSQAVQNPYGLQALWNEGDVVSKTTLFILILMSMGSWYIIISKFLQQAKISRQGKVADQSFWEASSLDHATENLEQTSAYRFIAEKGIHSTKSHEGTLLERIDFNTWVSISIQRAIDKINSHLGSGLAFLATVGSTAPFVGLFGTVWGIYHALTAIGVSGQASIDKVAGPVGEALIMTAIGLAVAVPAVLGYNWLVRRNKAVMDNVRSFGSDLHTVLLSGQMTNSSSSQESK